jgi:predicted dehydrogenase
MTKSLAFGVIGLGFGANHARVLSTLPAVRLIAVCDTDVARLDPAVEGQEVATYTDFATMLREQKLDAVVVAVPARLHEPVALAAIAAGAAVLIEKPLAPSLAAGLRLVDAARSAGVLLMAGHIERFNPALQELARRVRAGEIGRVLQITARRMGAIRVPPEDVNVVHDSALHDIDAMRAVLGLEVEEVYATAQTGVVTPLENSVSSLIRFASNDGRPGPLGALEVNWLSPLRLRDLTVLGENGLFVLQYAAQSLRRYRLPPRLGPVQGWSLVTDPDGDAAETVPVEPREQLVAELEAFVAAIRDGTPPPVTTVDALAALSVADAMTESARSGRPVRPQQV